MTGWKGPSPGDLEIGAEVVVGAAKVADSWNSDKGDCVGSSAKSFEFHIECVARQLKSFESRTVLVLLLKLRACSIQAI